MSSKNVVAVSVRGLSKSYSIAKNAAKHTTAGEALMHKLRHPFEKAERETFWALSDVSFDIQKGDVVGIIGRNGAGKSTLLKILSRITEPTAGRIDLYGRVGSLLEVGTGFHAELTGRENIFLNGAILGMSRAEIARQFDAIVDFSGTEQFLDTPVKRYSSGMYVRLAFAVAAHLNPEILIVDEVLAVGDAEFQKKCLGKMQDVAASGRTVLFVSHQMQAVQSLCNKAIHLQSGQIIKNGDVDSVLHGYMSYTQGVGSQAAWSEENAYGNEEVKLLGLSVSANGNTSDAYSSKNEVHINMEFIAYKDVQALCVGFDLMNDQGVIVLRSYQTDLTDEDRPFLQVGLNSWRCTIPNGLLNAGIYYICPKISVHSMYWIANQDSVIQFEIVLDHGVSPYWNVLDRHNRPGLISPILEWKSSHRSTTGSLTRV